MFIMKCLIAAEYYQVQSKGVDSVGQGFADPASFVRNLARQQRTLRFPLSPSAHQFITPYRLHCSTDRRDGLGVRRPRRRTALERPRAPRRDHRLRLHGRHRRRDVLRGRKHGRHRGAHTRRGGRRASRAWRHVRRRHRRVCLILFRCMFPMAHSYVALVCLR